MPSLAQLDEAVREYRREYPDDVVSVVVDATFGHRIDEVERATFEEAVAHNELVSPPAGAIGRGDAFLLRIAEKVGATVLSNDSFQEFHGEHDWLFNNGRLLGGKPVPEVGWVFTARTPVRGPKSRDAVRTSRKSARRPKDAEPDKKVEKAIAVATEEVVEPDSPSVKRRRRRTAAPPAEPVNDPLTFIEFVANHPLGSEVEGAVDTFSAHGAFVAVDGARCYVPLSGLGDPPPRAAREVLNKGERRSFVIQALDPSRRGIELALPDFAEVSGVPSPETVEEEIKKGVAASKALTKAATKKAATKRTGTKKAATEKVTAKKVTAEKVATRKLTTKTAPTKSSGTAATTKKAATKKAATKKAATKKAATKKAATRKAATKKAATKKAATSKAATRAPAQSGSAAGTTPPETSPDS